MVAIIDYQTGNLGSIQNMIKKVGGESIISRDPEVIAKADKLILPGVGHFDYGMRRLNQGGLVDVMNKRVLEDKVPILGICLGVQLFTRGSEEGDEPGLGWISADTVSFSKEEYDLRIPHMGWNEVEYGTSKLFADMHDIARFYFVHSFHLVCDDPEDVLTSTTYGYKFTAGVERDNILGVQFHPEKSHKYGMQLFTNFLNNY